jgi:carbamoyl-phosphate synthase large subunit
MKPAKIKKALILGSGGLKIGQAGEFDYSGSQAIKALKQEGIKTVLVNPNIATVQTDKGMADTLYLEPLNVPTLTQIIANEKPDAIFLGFGGQTALNLGMDLDAAGILKKYHIRVMGTPLDGIRATEDRELFREALESLEILTPKSISATSIEVALNAAEKIGYPVMLRSGFSLGGLGSGKILNPGELKERVTEVLNATPQVLIEEYLTGWKEFEYEIVRDINDNTLTICNMENLDPMGVHTGESIVVAPAQTLDNREHQKLRNIALKAARHFGIIGECNIQFAVNPKNGDYRVIEMNARLSRSSALASKATGYPLAFVAAKLALGKTLPELKNSITQKTCAFFEPALDYVVVKIPRWDTHKLKAAERRIGTEMKSVGEVMGIGKTFAEALNKAIQALNIGASSIADYPVPIENVPAEVEFATDRRLFALYHFFKNGGSISEAHKLSNIDPWFLNQIKQMSAMAINLSQIENSKNLLKPSIDFILPVSILKAAKLLGFSDKSIALLTGLDEAKIRAVRLKNHITPVIKQIDTLAGEFTAATNYLYLTYHGETHDIKPSKKAYLIIGSGSYAIGSSVEFDWCAVNMARTLRRHKKIVIMVNCNPETVSTDYDESDRLYFEPLSFERVQDIADFEHPFGIALSVGGQIANNLALPLDQADYKILGTAPKDIDTAEDRKKFSSLLHELNIDQPAWTTVTSLEDAENFVNKVGFPVLIRPSYVLSGAAMNVVYDLKNLKHYIKEASLISREHPVVMSQFIDNAKELEIDAVADHGEVIIEAISEHIENAGVHSGDATIILPPEKLYLKTIRNAKQIARQLAKALNITGPFNLQLIAKNNDLKVIECNVRASRSFPFVSKVTGHHFIEIATEILLGIHKPKAYNTLELDYVAVKNPQFSYNRFKGADPVAHVEMASTGEVACIRDDLLSAFYASWQATGQTIQGKKILLSIDNEHKHKLFPLIEALSNKDFQLFATEGTHDYLTHRGVGAYCVFKASEKIEPNIASLIQNHRVDLIINTTQQYNHNKSNSDGFAIRRLAIDHHIPLITNVQIAELLLRALVELKTEANIYSWQHYVKTKRQNA